jgi:colanic acid/amylovoran biosynthesis protein
VQTSAGMKPKKTIGLLWHSSKNENLGVGALTVANIYIVEQVAKAAGIEVAFRILSWTDPSPEQMHKDNVSTFAMRAKDVIKPNGLYAEVRNCDFVLDISAGDSFADIYGARRYLFNVGAKLITILARRPLINSPQTIGPFKLGWARMIATWLMKMSASVVTRDGMSTAYAQSLGVKNIVEATDVAMRLPYTKSDAANGKKAKVGFNVSGWLFANLNQADKMVIPKSDYAELCRALTKYFVDRPDCELHLVSHVIGGYQDDYPACEKLAKEFPGAVLVPRFMDPSSAKSYISGMDYFFGARMHACIAAFSSGVPVVPIAYSRKFAGLFSSLGYDATVDCITMTSNEIIAKVTDGFEKRAILKQQVEKSFANAGERLAKYEAVLRKELLKA